MTIALLFSPQGSQAIGMGRELAEHSRAAAAVYREADAVLGWSVSATCWTGPVDRLNDTRQTQPCLVTTSVAALAALREALETHAAAGAVVVPAFVAGHSVGEYAAVVAAGSLAFADAIRLVALRGRLMAAAGVDGGMAAVIGLDRAAIAAAVAELGSGDLVVANDNAPGQVVISGSRAALEAARPRLEAAGARRVIALNVSGPFHSPLMAPVGDALAAAFGTVTWSDADPPIVSNVTGQPVRDAATLRSLLARQASSPVEWVAGIRAMAEAGVDTFVECGPGTTLGGMVRRIVPGARTLNVADPGSLAVAVEALAAASDTSGGSRAHAAGARSAAGMSA
jgi:[acyl-carrier-protein] S-malonyltransferase